MTTSSDTPQLVTPDYVVEHLSDPDIRVIDTRYYLDGADPLAAYAESHVPGAAYVDVEAELTGHPGWGGGRHPLPSPEEFQATMRKAGVSDDSHVIVYSNGFAAARVWWLLNYFGHERVSLMDGGLAAWSGPLDAGPPVAPEPGDFTVRAKHDEWLTDFDEVTSLADETLLMDARGPDRFNGEVAPGDPYPGHLPGAVNAWWEPIGLDTDGRFATPAELQQRLNAVGLTEDSDAIAYCGSGFQACHLIFSTKLAGYDAPRLYVGSWSEYSRRVPADS